MHILDHMAHYAGDCHDYEFLAVFKPDGKVANELSYAQQAFVMEHECRKN